MTKFYRGEISDKDLPKGIKLFRQTLEKNPLDLRAMNYLAYMYHLTKDEVTAKRFHVIFTDYWKHFFPAETE
jgi:cytochrome c-type biogenesis protein CcmH/NrfG